MLTRYWEPIGHISEAQDPLPVDYREKLTKERPSMPREFRCVDREKGLYRSAIPYDWQLSSLQGNYGIKNIVSLVEGDWLENFYGGDEFHIHQFPIYQRSHLTPKRISQIVDVIKSFKEPTLVHCLKGSVRTGMVCASYERQVMQRSKARVMFNLLRNKGFNGSVIREVLTNKY